MNAEELKKKLTRQQYEVTQNKGTEPAYSGKYYKHKEKGTYHCVVCGSAIFSSDTKFDSSTGWPSFDSPVNTSSVILKDDLSHGMGRIEVTCAGCNAHLGHVFSDGPIETTSKRYCINSCALNFTTSS